MLVNIVTECSDIILEAHQLFLRLEGLIVLAGSLVEVIVSLVVMMMMVMVLWMMLLVIIVVMGSIAGRNAQLACLVVTFHA